MANKTPGEVKSAPKKPFKVLKNLRHDGKHYVPGKKVQLGAKDAKEQLALKTVAPWSGADTAGDVDDISAVGEQIATE
jgi:hypothetical protein